LLLPQPIATGLIGSRPWQVSRLTIGDLESLIENERYSTPDPWSPQGIKAELNGAHSFSFGIFIGDALAGQLYAQMVGAELTILNLSIVPSYRRNGLGRVLLRATLKHAGENGAREVHLEVRNRNQSAISLYLSEGFKQTGRRKSFYSDTGEDAILLLRQLPLLRAFSKIR